LGDKVPADQKAPIEAALYKLKDAHKAQDLAAIDTDMSELNTLFHNLSQEMYSATGGAGADQQAGANAGQGNPQGGGDNGDVTDVDFEEVK
jgi:molecular chaperone DnaK